jgi:hypothetical protein
MRVILDRIVDSFHNFDADKAVTKKTDLFELNGENESDKEARVWSYLLTYLS